jgi:hypothetical protein
MLPRECEAEIVDQCIFVPLEEGMRSDDIDLLYLEKSSKFGVAIDLLHSLMIPAFLKSGDKADEIVVVLG